MIGGATPRIFRGKSRSTCRVLTLAQSRNRAKAVASLRSLRFKQYSTFAKREAVFWTLKFGRYSRGSSDYSLIEAFGTGAIQDEEFLIIQKPDLGLDSINYSTRQLMLALVLKWSEAFQEDRRIRANLWRYQIIRGYERHIYTIQFLIPQESIAFSPHNLLL